MLAFLLNGHFVTTLLPGGGDHLPPGEGQRTDQREPGAAGAKPHPAAGCLQCTAGGSGGLLVDCLQCTAGGAGELLVDCLQCTAGGSGGLLVDCLQCTAGGTAISGLSPMHSWRNSY